MKWIRNKVLENNITVGMFCSLGSSITVEIAGNSGFDWLLLDYEHGEGDLSELLHQIQALEHTPSAPIVRIAWNDPILFKRALDRGAAGIMVPYVSTGKEAEQAVKSMRYFPQGIRGLAKAIRATGYTTDFDEYFNRANKDLLTVVQIETEEAVNNVNEIASVDGVDILFLGPTDLSTNLGIPLQLEHPKFLSAVDKVISACQTNDKTAGILALNPDMLSQAIGKG